MPSNFTKQLQSLSARYFNFGSGDAQVGGALTGVPSNIVASQYDQTLPGDRIVLGVMDAAAMSDTITAGAFTLYSGMYMYVRTVASTAAFTKGHLAFWSSASVLHNVTSDETGAMGVSDVAGWFINTLTSLSSWWIQIAGRTNCAFTAILTGVPSAGCAAYSAASGAGASVGTLDVLDGAPLASFTDVGNALNRYAGPAVTSPVGGATSLVDIPLNRLYRF